MNGLPSSYATEIDCKVNQKSVVSESMWFRNIIANDMEAPILATCVNSEK